MRIGILALQGAFELHSNVLNTVAYEKNIELEICEIRKPPEFKKIDGLIIPGGESTVISKLLRSSGLFEEIRKSIESGLPVFAACAGLILLCNEFGLLDCKVRRNAYGSQIDSFEQDVFSKLDGNYHKVSFIRAPKIDSVGKQVLPIAFIDQEVVGVKKENILATAFHPEVLGVLHFHELFLKNVTERVSFLAGNTNS